MTAIERYIDSLPLEPVQQSVLQVMIDRPDRCYWFSELREATGYSAKYTRDALVALQECGVVKEQKSGGLEPFYYLSDPRLLQHLGMERPAIEKYREVVA